MSSHASPTPATPAPAATDVAPTASPADVAATVSAAPPAGLAPSAPTAPPTAVPASPTTPSDPAGPAWPGELTTVAMASYEWFRRPRVRLGLAGVALAVTGALIVPSSVWTLPLVIGGALMVVIAWMGHRLDGRLTLQWGPAGTELAFRATIKAPAGEPAVGEAGALPAAHPAEALPSGNPAGAPAASRIGAATGGEVIEGDAHTVELDVTELKALIAAAESRPASARAATPAAADIRIHRAGSAATGAAGPAHAGLTVGAADPPADPAQ